MTEYAACGSKVQKLGAEPPAAHMAGVDERSFITIPTGCPYLVPLFAKSRLFWQCTCKTNSIEHGLPMALS